MPSMFRLDASIAPQTSASRALADLVASAWLADTPEGSIVRRDIGTDPVPAGAWREAVTAGPVEPASWSDAQRAATRLAATLTDELDAADALLFAVPLYNFGVSQHFKTYVDLAMTDPRLAPGGAGVIAGKPTVLVTVQGGNYAPGTPREGWDHSTDWLVRIVRDVWGTDLRVVSRSFTLVGVTPALDRFADIADEMRATAEEQARAAGRAVAAGAAVTR